MTGTGGAGLVTIDGRGSFFGAGTLPTARGGDRGALMNIHCCTDQANAPSKACVRTTKLWAHEGGGRAYPRCPGVVGMYCVLRT